MFTGGGGGGGGSGGGLGNNQYISQFTKEELEVLEKKKQAKILEIERQENEEKNRKGIATGSIQIPCKNIKVNGGGGVGGVGGVGSGGEHIEDRKIREAFYDSYGKYLLKDYYLNFNGKMYNNKGEVVGDIEEMRKKGLLDEKDNNEIDPYEVEANNQAEKLLKDIRVAVAVRGCSIDKMREKAGAGEEGTEYSEKDKTCIPDLSTEIITFEKMTYLVLALIEQNNRLQGENDALRNELVKKVLRDGGYSGAA